jgi:PAS domain S-box-containing protein
MHPQVYLSVLTAVAVAAMALYVGLRRERAVVHWLVIALMLSMLLWAVGVGLWRLLPDPRHQEIALMLGFAGAFSVPPLWLLLADRFTRRRWFDQRPGFKLAVVVPSALSVLVVFTNSNHHLFVQGFGRHAMGQIDGFAFAGPLFWVAVCWALVLVAAGISLYLSAAFRLAVNKELWRGLALGTAALGPMVTSAALTSMDLDFTPMGMGISVCLLFVLNWRYRILDTLPIARRHVIEHLTDGVLVTDLGGRILDLNPAAETILQASATKLLRRPVWSVVGKAVVGVDENDVERFVCSLASSEDPRLYEFCTEAGRAIEVSTDCVRGDDGEPLGLYAVLRDRTERRRYESFLRQAQRLETAAGLAAGVAHEVSNPLAFVCSNLSQIDRSVESVAEQLASLSGEKSEEIEELRMMIAESADGVERISGIVDRMRRFASLSQGEVGEVEVNTVTGAALKMAALHQRPGVELGFEPTDDLPPVHGSSELLIQAVLNLTINALQAVSQQDQGTVQVVTRSRDDAVEIRVSDDGPGIPRAIRDRIFDPFFTTKAPGEGSGLGLAITYDIIREHRGVLELRSEEGEGAEFTIRLPARSGS